MKRSLALSGFLVATIVATFFFFLNGCGSSKPPSGNGADLFGPVSEKVGSGTIYSADGGCLIQASAEKASLSLMLLFQSRVPNYYCAYEGKTIELKCDTSSGQCATSGDVLLYPKPGTFQVRISDDGDTLILSFLERKSDGSYLSAQSQDWHRWTPSNH